MDDVRKRHPAAARDRPAHVGAAGRDDRRRRQRRTPTSSSSSTAPICSKLEALSKQLVDRVKKLPGVVDVDTSLNTGKPELSVQVDRPKAADLGVQIGDAAEALRLLVGGDR